VPPVAWVPDDFDAWGRPPAYMTTEQDHDDLAQHERDIAARESD
jgi:hypothetical protein